MNRLLLLFLSTACLLSLRAQGQVSQVDTTYSVDARPLDCGQIVQGSFAGAQNRHQMYIRIPPGCTNIPYCGRTGSDGSMTPELTFRFVLADTSWVRIDQTEAKRHNIVLCEDSSNLTPMNEAMPYVTLRLAPGDYYVNLEQGRLGAPIDPQTPIVYDTTYALRLTCSALPLDSFQNVAPLAEPLGAALHAVGRLDTARSELQRYRRRVDSRYIYPYSYLAYNPEPEKVYAFTLPIEASVSVANVSRKGHQVYLVDTSGSTGKTFAGNGLIGFGLPSTPLPLTLAAGTYYLVVEQGSATAGDIYDYQISYACAPAIDSGMNQYLNIGMSTAVILNGAGDAADYSSEYVQYRSYADYFNQATATLNVGGANNTLTAYRAVKGYMRLFVDFNHDGDFDDADETIYTDRKYEDLIGDPWGYLGAVPTKTTDNFTLPGQAYAQYAGGSYRLRMLISDTLLGGGCGHYSMGFAMDIAVHVQAPAVDTSRALWQRQAAGGVYDAFQFVSAAPGGGVYGVGRSGQDQYGPSSGNMFGRGQTTLTDGLQQGTGPRLQGYAGHFTYTETGYAVRYLPDGRIRWMVPLTSSGVSGAYLEFTGTATDSLGNLYVAGNSYANGPGGYNEGGIRGFVVKLDTAGNYVYSYVVGPSYYSYSSYNLTGIAIGPRQSVLVSGHFAHTYYSSVPLDSIRIYGPGGGDTARPAVQGGSDAFVAKFSNERRLEWLAQLGGAGHDSSLGIAVSPDGWAYTAVKYDTAVTLFAPGGVRQALPAPQGSYNVGIVGIELDGGGLDISQASSNAPLRLKALVGTVDGVLLGGSLSGPTHLGSATYTADSAAGFVIRTGRVGNGWASLAGGPGRSEVSALSMGADGRVLAGITYSQALTNPFGGEAIYSSGSTDAAVLTLDTATGQAQPGEAGFAFLGGGGSDAVLGVAPVAGGVYMAGTFSGMARFGSLGNFTSAGDLDGYVTRFRLLPQDADNTTATRPATKSVTQGLLAWPNPSAGEISIRFVGMVQAEQRCPLQVLDATGRLVYTGEADRDKLTAGYRLPVVLQPGFYIVRCQAKSCRVTVR